MEKLFREVRCVSIGKNDVKFIPENLVKKPGYLDKHGLIVQELPEKLAEIKAEPFHKKDQEPVNEDKTKQKPLEEAKKEEPKPVTPAPVAEVKKEEDIKEKDSKQTGKIKVDA